VHHVHQSRSNSKPGPLNSDAIPGAVLPVGFKEVYQESDPQPPVDALKSNDNGAIGALGALSEGMDPDPSKLIADQANQTTDPWDSFLKETAE
jgi:hypothetical protein